MKKICHSKISNLIFAKFAFSCSLRSHQKANPTPKMAAPYLALPTHHPEKDSKIGIERVQNEIQNNTTEKKSRNAWDATAANLGLAQAGHCLVGKCLWNNKLCGSWQMCVSPACAKPLLVSCHPESAPQKSD